MLAAEARWVLVTRRAAELRAEANRWRLVAGPLAGRRPARWPPGAFFWQRWRATMPSTRVRPR